MTSPSDYTDKLAEVSGQLAEANAYMSMALRPDEVLNSVTGGLGGVEACLAKLAIAIPGITSWGLTDSNTSRMITNAMSSAIMEVGNLLGDLFVPLDFEADPDSLAGSVDNYLKAVMSSLMNPLSAVIATQQNLLSSSLSQIQGILYKDTPGADRGFINQYGDRLERMFKMLFIGDADLRLAGMLLFAFEEGIPAIESELVYLRQLKKLAKTGLEDVANLPDIITTGGASMMNAATASKLCCGEEALRRVESDLITNNIFNRQKFGEAMKCVCTAKDNIFNGTIDQDFIDFHAGNVIGMSQAQFQSLRTLRFMPNLEFKLNIVKINLFIQHFEEADRDTRTLHNNFMLAADTLSQLAETRLGDIMALLVSLIRIQVSGVRADLESQAQGFSGYNDAKTEGDERRRVAAANQDTLASQTAEQRRERERDRKDGNPPLQTASASTQQPYKSGLDQTVKPGSKGAAFGGQQVDVFAYMSAQASAYVVLTAACYIMKGTTMVYSSLDKVLAGESRMVKFIEDFVSGLKSECPNSQGGAEVVATTATYVRALEDRLNGVTQSNEQVIAAAQAMVRRIEEYERFLACFKKQLFFGNEKLGALITSLASALAAYQTARALIQQIRAIIKMYPELKALYKNFDLAKFLGVGAAQYNALDTLVGALQCLVLQCDNPFVTDLASSAASQFQKEFSKRRSDTITMGSIDEVPKTGMLTIILGKVQTVMKLIQLVNSLTNFDIKALCAIKTPANAGGPALNAMADAFKAKVDDTLIVDTAPWRQKLVDAGVRRQPDGTIR